MDKSVLFYSCFLLAGTFISSLSQVMLKKAAGKHKDSFLAQYLDPIVILAYLIFFGTTFLGIYAYRGIPLSLGPVLEATGYIYVSFWGVRIFGEKWNMKKTLGLLCILGGIVVYVMA